MATARVAQSRGVTDYPEEAAKKMTEQLGYRKVVLWSDHDLQVWR